ncbi:phosphoribosylanthranilate isomerase [Alphaproteobacteria bacterium]|nr:phosphoribosylanthranilate isomerase [Alphaproteobacteria bacterium]
METNKTKIKVCGLKHPFEVKCAADYGATWYGMIFEKVSPRFINYKKAEVLLNSTPDCIKPIAVTVNPSNSKVQDLNELGFKYIQLHGNESINFCISIKKKFNLKIIKAISVKSLKDLKYAKSYKNIVDWILFDYKDDLLAGGTGKSFDWSLLDKNSLNFNWILSGGLDYNNIDLALKSTKATAVDVSSGVEVKKGIKSTELIKEFCNKINNI